MSGLLAHSPLHAIASALPGSAGHFQRNPRATPALSLFLSGGCHAVLLAAFLIASSRERVEKIVTIAEHPYFIPPIDMRPPMPPVRDSGGTTRDDGGLIDPVDPKIAPPDMPFPKAGPIEGPARRDGPPDGGGPSDKFHGGIPTNTGPDSNAIVPYDEAPVPIYSPEPVYSEIAREAALEGLVKLEVVVTSEGAVRDIRVLEGNIILANDAVKTIRTWKFKPGKWNGHPVTTKLLIPVRFTLRY